MAGRVCVDANMALKLVLDEPDSLSARPVWANWIEQDVEVVAPTVLPYEVTAVIRNNVYRRRLTPEEGATAFHIVHAQDIQLLCPDGLHQRAWELAIQYDRPTTHDTHYLALAEMLGCELWTADERLFNAIKGKLAWVQWLGAHRDTA